MHNPCKTNTYNSLFRYQQSTSVRCQIVAAVTSVIMLQEAINVNVQIYLLGHKKLLQLECLKFSGDMFIISLITNISKEVFFHCLFFLARSFLSMQYNYSF